MNRFLRRGVHRGPRALSVRVRAVLGLGAVLGAGTIGTQAAWTDAVSVVGATFSTGTLDLQVNGADVDADFTSISMAGMIPGSATAGVLTVRNNGTVPLAYTASGVTASPDTKNLAGALVVKVTGDATTSGSAGSRTCAGAVLAGTGAALDGALVGTRRVLAPGASEKLCVQVTLPATAPSSLQGAATTATLTFTGTSDLS